jgi:transcription-repair coupling factor (superfamily II helicase)
VVGFRENTFANPAGLLGWVQQEGSLSRVRPDQKIVLIRDWEDPDKRLKGTTTLLNVLARLAEEGEKAAA